MSKDSEPRRWFIFADGQIPDPDQVLARFRREAEIPEEDVVVLLEGVHAIDVR